MAPLVDSRRHCFRNHFTLCSHFQVGSLADMTNLTWLRMLDQVTTIVRQYGPLTAAVAQKQTILSLLEHYQSNESDFKSYIHFGASGYTKNLIRELNQGECNIIIMCWAGSQSSAFHAHEGSRCFVKVLSGQLREQQVPYPKQLDASEQVKIKTKILNSNDVTYIDDSIGLHKVSNLSATQPAVTLHIYMPAYKRCRIFDATGDNNVLTISTNKSNEVTFNTIHGAMLI